MKKLLKRIALFLPTALVSYLLLLWFLGDLGWVRTGITKMGNTGHLNGRIKDIRNYHDVDILFLGSSHSYRTFDTRFYEARGYSCFNLGSSTDLCPPQRVPRQPHPPCCYFRGTSRYHEPGRH